MNQIMTFTNYHAKQAKDEKDKNKVPRQTIKHGKKESLVAKKLKDTPENFKPLEVKVPFEKSSEKITLDRGTA